MTDSNGWVVNSFVGFSNQTYLVPVATSINQVVNFQTMTNFSGNGLTNVIHVGGSSTSIVSSVSLQTARMKGLLPGTGITLTDSGTNISIASTTGASALTNAANFFTRASTNTFNAPTIFSNATFNALVLMNAAQTNSGVLVVTNSIDSAQRNLIGGSTVVTVHYGDAQLDLSDASGVFSVKWGSRQSLDSSGNTSEEYGNRRGRASNGVVTFDWNLGDLIDKTSGFQVYNWTNRTFFMSHTFNSNITVTGTIIYPNGFSGSITNLGPGSGSSNIVVYTGGIVTNRFTIP